jgi:hypothetical protein
MVSVIAGVMLASLFRVMLGVRVVALRDVRVMRKQDGPLVKLRRNASSAS